MVCQKTLPGKRVVEAGTFHLPIDGFGACNHPLDFGRQPCRYFGRWLLPAGDLVSPQRTEDQEAQTKTDGTQSFWQHTSFAGRLSNQ